MDDGNRVSADAPFWWTSVPQLHTFTLSSADALWLKGVRERALAVARTPWSDAAGPRTAQLAESQNFRKRWEPKTPILRVLSIKDLTVDCRLSFSIFWNAKAFLANLHSLLALCVDLARRQPTSLLRGLLSAHLQAESRQRRRLLPPRRRWIGARPESVGADVQPPQAVPLPSEDDARDRRREPRLAGAPLALERHPAPNAPAPSSSRTR